MNIPSITGLNNPANLSHGVVTSIATAALALVDPRKLNRGQRFLYRGLVTGLTAWVVHTNLDDGDLESLGLDHRVKPVITAGLGAAALAAMPMSERLDAHIHNVLDGAGLRHPRALMSAGVGALMAGSWWAARNTPDQFGWYAYASESDWEEALTEVPAVLLDFLTRVLSATDDFGAPALRSQLAGIRMLDETGGGPLPQFSFDVWADSERAVPHMMTFPVIGRLSGPNGLALDLELYVYGGQLQSLTFGVADGTEIDDVEAWLTEHVMGPEGNRWAWFADVELLLETPAGVVPVSNGE